MRVHILLSAILIILMVGCSNETPAITKIDTKYTTEQSLPVVEDAIDNEEADDILEFHLPKEQVIINLNRVTILKQYLASKTNKSFIINKMHLSRLDIPNNEDIYLLRFSCANNRCSYLLLDQRGDGQSYLLEDLTMLEQVLPSPNNTNLLFIFNRNEGGSNSLHKMVLMDINEWEEISLQATSENGSSLIALDGYKWPIKHVEWIDNNTITISIPNVKQPTNEYLNSLTEKEGKLKTIEVTIKE